MRFKRSFYFFLLILHLLVVPTTISLAAQNLSMVVIDAKNGKELFSQNSLERRQPASLTKMMTLYLTFYAIERTGKLSLDQRVKVSNLASKEPPSRLGLKVGQTETVRNLIRSAALKSANDSATVLAEAISGSEEKFAEYMTNSAEVMGMKDTQFKNAHGLTEPGHYSTASDMAILARRLLYDFPDYYHLFGKTFTYVGSKKINNTNWKFLKTYKGADGIKTGFTNAAGFNLAGSAERSSGRVIGIILGAEGSGERTKRMTEMLDIGFSKIGTFPKILPLAPINLEHLSKNNILYLSKLKDIPPERSNLALSTKFTTQIRKSNFSKSLRPKIFLKPESASLDLSVIKDLDTSYKTFRNSKDHQIQVGFYYTESNAQADMTKVMLSSIDTLGASKTNVVEVVKDNLKGYALEFYGLTAPQAMKSCARIRVIKVDCFVSLQ